MESFFQLLARRGNDAANEWLARNPIILSLIFGAIGAALLITGIMGLKSGVTRSKYGTQITGGSASFVSVIRVIGGVICFGVALYHLIF